MLVSSKKKKGKLLEKFVADQFKDIFTYAYSRADSGSGKFHKEDVSLPREIPLHIECKNQATLDIGGWWRQTLDGCPANKHPVLIYKLPFHDPQVYLYLDALAHVLGLRNEEPGFDYAIPVTLEFKYFKQLLKDKYKSITT